MTPITVAPVPALQIAVPRAAPAPGIAHARNAGNPALADSSLIALSNQLRAQSGKHITTGAAAELQAYDTLLRDGYEGIVSVCSRVPLSAALLLGPQTPQLGDEARIRVDGHPGVQQFCGSFGETFPQ